MTDDRLVTAVELATWFGEISPSAVRAMAARGVIVKEARGRFPLKASVVACCNHMRTVATGKGEGTASDERKRLARLRHRWPSSACLRDKGPCPRVENAGTPHPETGLNFPVG
jgi:hypothetical protein